MTDIKSEIDQRDVDRFMTDDKYAALFVQWSKKVEDAPNLVVKCFKWRHEQKINGILMAFLTAPSVKLDFDVARRGWPKRGNVHWVIFKAAGIGLQ